MPSPHIPKKSLSQNFLKEEFILEKIAQSSGLSHLDWIIEIGAGQGSLTKHLAKHASRVIAIEFDRDLLPELLRKFPLSSNVSIESADILSIHLEDLLSRKGFRSGESIALFGNIPYGITGKILRKIVALDPAPDTIVLLVQKEIAERLEEKNGKSSLISLATKLFGTVETLFIVPRDAFFPSPKVESAVIRIFPQKDRLPFSEREDLLHLAKIGFSSKRKKLVNLLAGALNLDKTLLLDIFSSLELRPDIRAEALHTKQWELLGRKLRSIL